MPAQQISLSAAANSDPLRIGLVNFATGGAGLFVTITGTLTAKVQASGDPTFPPTNWVDLDTMTALSASAMGSLAFPATAVRLVVTAYTSGRAVLDVVQAEFR